MRNRNRSADAADKHATTPKQYTGTACPNCGLQQWRCPSGITCDNGDGYDSESDIPFPATKEPEEQSLDEALAELPTERSKSRKKATTSSSVDAVQESMSTGKLDRIVERIFQFDFDGSFNRVEAFLKPGDDRRLDFGMLQRELDKATDEAATAHRLYTNAREAREIFEIDKEIQLAPLREQARYQLECERKSGARSKSITDADILGMIAAQDPRLYRHLRVQSIRMEATVDHLERLSDLARKRIDTLNTLVEKKR
jgi:hypothetical protein